MATEEEEIKAVFKAFDTGARFMRSRYDSLRRGYEVSAVSAAGETSYFLKKIDTRKIPNPLKCMERISKICRHLRTKLEGDCEYYRKALDLVSAADGSACWMDGNGKWWKMFRFIEGATPASGRVNAKTAFAVGASFGRFMDRLSDLPADDFAVSEMPRAAIDAFPDFDAAVDADICGRVCKIGELTDFVDARRTLAARFSKAALEGRFALTVAHNAASPGKVLVDDETGAGLAVTGLEYAGAGYAFADFGDLVRLCSAEESADGTVYSRADVFEALVRGFALNARFIGEEERSEFAFAGLMSAFNSGVRSLVNYINGEALSAGGAPGDDLAACRSAFKLVESLEKQFSDYDKILREALRPAR